ncbi:MAG: carboxylating nicotinate-nucleotide diphosphorylase [Pseudomonadota bacterium]
MSDPACRLAAAAAVRDALREDFGDAGDITSTASIPSETRMRAEIRARNAGVLSGVELARQAFRQVDPYIAIKERAADGARLEAGETVLSVEGNARAILAAERTALNFLQHLSGVATATRALVDAIDGTTARIVCTRKTTPGLRIFEKAAVRHGGGANHRFGLYDAVLIKDNHIAAAGGVRPALERAKVHVGHLVKIEIEVDGLDQLEEVLAVGTDAVLLDNMAPGTLCEAVAMIHGRAISEASGDIRLETVRAVAETGVDCISSGWITHSAPALNLGLDAV